MSSRGEKVLHEFFPPLTNPRGDAILRLRKLLRKILFFMKPFALSGEI